MARSYLTKAVSKTSIPQSEPLDERQVPNSAGGYAYPVDDKVRLDRFLILGTEGGSYYSSERDLTKTNVKNIERLIKGDGLYVVSRVADISLSGRAPKNDPALFVLAMCAAHGNDETREAAFAALPKVARIGTHLFHFAQFVQAFRGWGRGLRSAVGEWYQARGAEKLALQLIKYQSRDGWTHRDLLRLSHPKPKNEEQKILFNWAVKGWPDIGDKPHSNDKVSQVWAFEAAKRLKPGQTKELVGLIRKYDLPRECVPTEFLREKAVWEALLENMPLTAMIRNLGNMTEVELLKPNSKAVGTVIKTLGNRESLQKARIHPVAVLMALRTYSAGHGIRGSKTWTPVQSIVDVLDEAFYLAFDNVPSTGKRWFLGLDISGSMWSGNVAGVPNFCPGEATAALALVTMRTEKQYFAGTFTTQFKQAPINAKMDLTTASRALTNCEMGGTDCSLPMLYALQRQIEADVFVILTDSETWAGKVHPTEALRQYREKMGIPAKLAVVGMVSNDFTIADPNDAGQMDVVGFDTAVPTLLNDFVSGGGTVTAEEE